MIIGITGPAGSGKSTMANYLVMRHEFTRLSLADPIKQMVYYMLQSRGCEDPDRWVYGDLKEIHCDYLCGKTPRHAMQTLGTEWGRECIGQNLWTQIMLHRIEKTHGNVVIDDVRFEDEALICNFVVKVTGRGGIPGQHASENGVYSWDTEFENTGSIADLQDFCDTHLIPR